MDVKTVLFDLASAVGVSGDEAAASARALYYLRQYTQDTQIDRFGNVLGRIGNDPAKPTVLLDAHIDQIGLIVTYIDEHGFLKVGNIGGVDRRLLLAQPVIVHGSLDLPGVICSKPPHLERDEESKKVPEMDDIAVDIGLSREEAQELLSLGDRVTIAARPAELLGGRVTGPSFDDRSGVTSILCALDRFAGEYPCNIIALFSVQEELSGRGAKISAFNVDADWALAMDVTFAETPDCEAHKCGRMGGGVMIGASPSLDKRLTDTLITLAKEGGIPYQIEVMPGMTSTNADHIASAKGGTPAGTLSIPLRYMHTPVETLQLSDIEATASLICAFLEHAGKEGAHA